MFTFIVMIILSSPSFVLAQANTAYDRIEKNTLEEERALYESIEPTNYITTLKGIPHRGIAQVIWTTEGEENNHYFSVERSDDGGRVFKEVKKVIAENKCRKTKYTFDDPKLIKGSAIYRIYQIDFEGEKSMYHQQLTLEGEETTDLTIHAVKENKKNTKATIVFSAHQKGKIDFFLYNIIGKPLQQKTWLASTGANYKQFNTNDIPDGIYMVLIRQGNDSFVERFIKKNNQGQYAHP